MHYYQFNIGDYASHTKSLSLIEDIAYRRLMDEYYLHEQPINGCSTDVARAIGMRDYADDVAYVLERFFQKDGDSWRQKRIDREIDQYHKQIQSKSKAGQASAKARRAKACEHSSNARSTDDEQLLNSVEQTKNQEPITKNQEPNKEKKGSPEGSRKITFNSWIKRLNENGEKPVPEKDPIFDYARDAGIPREFLLAAWTEFKAKYTDDSKTYTDWRKTFRNAVRGNWFKLWWHDGIDYKLTSIGQQAMAALEAKRNGQ